MRNTRNMSFLFWLCAFLIGGAGYCLIEIIWRGYTHLSMAVAGGICFCALFLIHSGSNYSFIEKCFIGGSCISAVELITGCVVNLWMGLHVWDYSTESFNFLGQICLRFFIMWCALSGIIFLALKRIPIYKVEPGS